MSVENVIESSYTRAWRTRSRISTQSHNELRLVVCVRFVCAGCTTLLTVARPSDENQMAAAVVTRRSNHNPRRGDRSPNPSRFLQSAGWRLGKLGYTALRDVGRPDRSVGGNSLAFVGLPVPAGVPMIPSAPRVVPPLLTVRSTHGARSSRDVLLRYRTIRECILQTRLQTGSILCGWSAAAGLVWSIGPGIPNWSARSRSSS